MNIGEYCERMHVKLPNPASEESCAGSEPASIDADIPHDLTVPVSEKVPTVAAVPVDGAA